MALSPEIERAILVQMTRAAILSMKNVVLGT